MMKFLLISSLLLSLNLATSNVEASVGEDAGMVSMYVLGTASWVALTVYSPVVAGGALGGLSVSMATVATSVLPNLRKEAVKNALNADAQEFYLTGNVSAALAKSVSLLKEKTTNLSDAEAIDLLVESVNK
ncbi:MAG: hypothetical protein ACXVLQ_03615 [Bacteriovorax sp.]